MRYAAYAAVLIAAALAGAALTAPSSSAPATPAPPATLTVAPPADGRDPPPSPASAPPSTPTPTTPTSSLVGTGVATTPPTASSAPEAVVADDLSSATTAGHDHDHGGDGAGAPIDPADVATQFTLAALNDRHDTAPADRRAALDEWAAADVVGAWADTMTAAERDAATVRSTAITAIAVTPLAAGWTVSVDATVTTSSPDGPTTGMAHHLELHVDELADGLRVTAVARTVES